MSTKTPIERLTELAEGWECASEAEKGIMVAFQQWKEMWDAGERDDFTLRRVREWLNARTNRERFEKDAAAVRWALAALTETPTPGDRKAVVPSDAQVERESSRDEHEHPIPTKGEEQ